MKKEVKENMKKLQQFEPEIVWRIVLLVAFYREVQQQTNFCYPSLMASLQKRHYGPRRTR
jgi:hypothetical protein